MDGIACRFGATHLAHFRNSPPLPWAIASAEQSTEFQVPWLQPVETASKSGGQTEQALTSPTQWKPPW